VTGHRLITEWSSSPVIKKRIAGGGAQDFDIMAGAPETSLTEDETMAPPSASE
jgi:hypothetical protein